MLVKSTNAKLLSLHERSKELSGRNGHKNRNLWFKKHDFQQIYIFPFARVSSLLGNSKNLKSRQVKLIALKHWLFLKQQ